jgi:4-diphosphocytidyl-2-C-methyl-D-erythritol kinase
VESFLKRVRLFTPAKINAKLLVGDTRPDKYHEIDSIFVCIELFDIVEVSCSQEDKLICSDPELETEDNIVCKALRLSRELIGIPPIRISIEKWIPSQAGLGGGSSNCGAFLHALNELLGRPLSQLDMLDIGLACGSDVPFFVARLPCARVQGRGEIVTPIACPDWSHATIAKPSSGSDTGDAYQRLDQIRRSGHHTAGQSDDSNDFDETATPESRRLIDLLGSGAHLCGSGSAVYAPRESLGQAREDAEYLQSLGYWAVGVRRVDRLPEVQWI